MADLPFATHRYLIEQVSGQQHMSTTLIRKFLKFILSIRNSTKPVLRQLYSITKSDVRTTTGSNLRNILMLTNLKSVDDLLPETVHEIRYKEIKKEDMWRIPIIMEAMDIKSGDINPPDGWTTEEIDEILEYVCTE